MEDINNIYQDISKQLCSLLGNTLNSNRLEIIDNKYIFIGLLGSGCASEVYTAWSFLDRAIYALKLFKKDHPDTLQKKFVNELTNLKMCSHKNVIKVFYSESDGIRKIYQSYSLNLVSINNFINDVTQLGNCSAEEHVSNFLHSNFTSSHSFGGQKYIVLEYCDKLDLFSYIFYSKRGLGEDISRYYFKQLLQSIKYMHSEIRVSHRDLKSENMLFDDNFQIKVADFGFSKNLTETDHLLSTSGAFKTKTRIGTEGYESPELVEGKAYCPIKNDIFSLGVVLFNMIFGIRPFRQARSTDNYYRNFACNKKDDFWIKHSKQIVKVSDELKCLINSMFEYLPDKRITANDILEHDWFKMDIDEPGIIEIMKEMHPVIEKNRKEELESSTIQFSKNQTIYCYGYSNQNRDINEYKYYSSNLNFDDYSVKYDLNFKSPARYTLRINADINDNISSEEIPNFLLKAVIGSIEDLSLIQKLDYEESKDLISVATAVVESALNNEEVLNKYKQLAAFK